MREWMFEVRSRPFVLLAALFAAVSLTVYGGVTAPLDEAVQSALHRVVGDPALDGIMQSVTEAGDVFNMMIFAIAILLIPRTRRIGITIMILIVISTLLAGYVKCGVDRNGPDYEFEGVPFPVSISRDTFALFCEGSIAASYPAGHAARAMALAAVLGYALSGRFPRGAYLMLLYPALMSVSRVYVMQHYLMDVVGGVIVGAMLAGVLMHKTKLYRMFEGKGGGADSRGGPDTTPPDGHARGGRPA